MTAAVIYTRFSPRPNAEECDSCEKQEERCRAYCKQKGFQIGGVYSDPDTSGGVLDRPGLSAAIEAIRGTPEVVGTLRGVEVRAVPCLVSPTVLVVDATDRLARDMLVSLTIRHEVEKAGGRIEYANGTPAEETPEGKLFSNILAAFAAYERDRIRHATSRGMKRRQANGEWFGKPPVGWMLDPEDNKKLIECPQEQRDLRAIKLLRDQKLTSVEIAAWLNEDERLFRGNSWSARTIRRLLQGEKESAAP